MAQNCRHRYTMEKQVIAFPSLGASDRKNFQTCWNSSDNLYKDSQQIDEPKLGIRRCYQRSSKLDISPLGNNSLGYYESRIDSSTLFKMEFLDLESEVSRLDNKVFNLENKRADDRTEFHYILQNQKAQLKEKDSKLNIQKCQLQCMSEDANGCLDEIVDALEGIQNDNITAINYTCRPRVCNLEVGRKHEKVFGLMRNLQQKTKAVHEREVDMVSTIEEQKESILRLEKENREFQEHFEMENEYHMREKQGQTFKSLHEINIEEKYLSLKNKSQDLRDAKVKRLEENIYRMKIELRDRNDQVFNIMKERDELALQLREQRRHASKQTFKTEADSNENYEAHKKKIQDLEKEMKTKDSDINCLEKMLESRKVNQEVQENQIEEKNNQLLEYRHAMESLRKKKADIEEENATLKKKLHHLEAEVERCNEKNKWLEKTLDRKRKEISDTNEQYVNAAKEKDDISSKFSDLRKRTYKTYDSEARVNKTVTPLKAENQSLENEIKLRDAKVKYLEKQLESKNINIGERIKQLENKLQDKDGQITAQKYQHQQVVTRLHEKESELEENIISLKKKIQNLEAEVERCKQTNGGMEKTVDHKNKELSETNERFKRALKENDANSSQVRDLQQRTTKTYDSEAELNKTIRALKLEIEKYNEEMRVRDAEVKYLEEQLQSKTSNLHESISQLKKQIQEKNDQLSAQSNQHQQVVRRLHEEESKLKATITSLKKTINDLEADAQRLVSKINDLEEQLKNTKIAAKEGLRRDVPGLYGDVQDMENMITGLKQDLKQTRTKLRDTEAELNETKTRLSKAMGERLTDNNPNITDLGDKNRPTKLAERFAELYDNQWTDAFDILEKKFDTEEGAIEALLHILQDAMSFCKTKEREQTEDLRRVLVFADKTVRGAEAVDMQKLFKDNRKAMAPSAVENLFQVYVEHIRRSTDVRLRMAMEVKSYAKECLEICWLMTVQDPPVVFAPLLRRGAPFNNELFRPYTKSGSNVAFVVWPTLLLHDHGPVLAKGVAQGAGTP